MLHNTAQEKNWLEPNAPEARWHVWKACDELFQARNAVHNENYHQGTQRFADALNHMLMAMERTRYQQQSVQPQTTTTHDQTRDDHHTSREKSSLINQIRIILYHSDTPLNTREVFQQIDSESITETKSALRTMINNGEIATHTRFRYTLSK